LDFCLIDLELSRAQATARGVVAVQYYIDRPMPGLGGEPDYVYYLSNAPLIIDDDKGNELVKYKQSFGWSSKKAGCNAV
jgi:hypothetical protein